MSAQREDRKQRGHHIRFEPSDPAYWHPRREGIARIEWWLPLNRWGHLRMAQWWRTEAWRAGRQLYRYTGRIHHHLAAARACPPAPLP